MRADGQNGQQKDTDKLVGYKKRYQKWYQIKRKGKTRHQNSESNRTKGDRGDIVLYY